MQGDGLSSDRPLTPRGEEIRLRLDRRGPGARRKIQKRARGAHDVGEGHDRAAMKAPAHRSQRVADRELRYHSLLRRFDEPNAEELGQGAAVPLLKGRWINLASPFPW